MSWDAEIRIARETAAFACRLAVRVRAALMPSDRADKSDRSPVTVADFGVQALISLDLASAFPNDPIMAEEDAAGLEGGGQAAGLRSRVVESVQWLRPDLGENRIVQAIGRCGATAGLKGRCWCLDPIDGTKGFIRGGQYALALSLLVDGRPVIGVMACPNLPAGDPGQTGRIYTAVLNRGARVGPLDGRPDTPIKARASDHPAGVLFCESVESEHVSHKRMDRVRQAFGASQPPLRMDSQCKYGLVADGRAGVYLRVPLETGHREKPWDHAAGALIVQEAGGRVTDLHGRPLDFSTGQNLTRNFGIIAAAASIHDRVLQAFRQTL
ncbi:MAG: 3'(2'),5'-bisphosphate nucleotidase [Proteobacteria bacterium]|nr:3'(2'),5'-bisphosphate nucleotidase [Pseudomonadota bacterium]